MPSTILVADDERKIAQLVASYLEASGFRVLCASDGSEAIELWRKEAPACLILDINMPGMDGLSAAREIRKTSKVPIIFLTAKADESDRIVGLELGGDDYVVKPFSPRELVSRVRAVLRRSGEQPAEEACGDLINEGGIRIDLERRSVNVDGAPRELTTVQLDILAFLARKPGRVFSRLEILEGAIGTAYEGYDRTIDAHIKNIRKALGDQSECTRFIGTVRGVGYKFIEAES